jgi:hypothetical protein
MKKLYLVTVELDSGARTAYRLTARNHTAAGELAQAIARKSGIVIRLVSIGELE